MRILSWLPFSLILAGCATAGPEVLPAPSFSTAVHFAAPAIAPAQVDPLAVGPAMREFLDRVIKPGLRDRTPQQALLQALINRSELKIEYDAVMTRNAEQTFETRAGNCLSLVLMTAAFARELNLNVTFNLVSVDDIWIRHDGLQSAIGHVNLTLGKRLGDLHGFHDAHETTTVDFLPSADMAHQRSREISEAKVLAMYFNNRAVELLAGGRVDDAYWMARAAVQRDPAYASARNTLGVIYLRHHDLEAAAEVFDAILQRDPGNITALVNKIHLLTSTGQLAAAATLTQTLRRLQPVQPFEFLDRGIEAMRRDDVAGAQLLFQKELERDAYDAETLYWLGTAAARLGQTAQARDYLREAVDNSTTGERRMLYVAKLQRLKAGLLK